jgi:hypothetical protein
VKKPNFFIVGAPKCGTTALSEYLRAHPNIFMSWPKEPHYFADDFDRFRRIKTLDEYRDIFRPANETHLAVGEASVWYLYSSVALKNIKKFNEQAKIIVMLRNPLDFVQSLHAELVACFFENQIDLNSAWNLQSSRKEQKNIPSTCQDESFLQYAQVARFGDQIERLFNVFPKEQIKIILLEDFSKSTRAVYEEILDFIDVPSDGRSEFPKINMRREIKVAWLAKMLYHPPAPLKWLERTVKNSLESMGIREFGFWHKFLNMNTKPLQTKPISPDFRRELIDEFRDDIEKLSQLLKMDLRYWIAE